MRGARAISRPSTARRRSMPGARPIPTCRSRFTTRPRSISTGRSTAPIWCSCTNGTRPIWSRASRRIAGHGGRYLLLFHDTHHRMATDPDAIARFDLDGFDGVLAFGEVLSRGLSPPRLGAAGIHLARGGRSERVPSASRKSRASAISSGSAIGATTSARAELSRISDRAGPGSRPFGPRAWRALPAGGTRRARRCRHRLRRLSAEFPGAARPSPRRG